MRHNHVHRKSVYLLPAALAALSLVLAGCSSEPASADKPSSDKSSSTVQDITLATIGVGAFNAIPYIAQEKGYFNDANLKVTILIAGANAANSVISGEADIAQTGSTAALFPVANGKETSLIFENDTLASFTYFGASDPGVKSLQDCKIVAAASAGTPPYAMAVLMKEKTNANYNVVPYNTPDAQLAALLSGNADCTAGTLSFLKPSLDNKKVHVIAAPDVKGTIPASIPLDAPGIAVWGLSSHLQSERVAVERFVGAMVKAADFFEKSSDEDVATLLRKNDNFKPVPLEQLTQQVATERPFLPKDPGQIPKASWSNYLEFAKVSVKGLSVDDPGWAYTKRVDMSFLTKSGN